MSDEKSGDSTFKKDLEERLDSSLGFKRVIFLRDRRADSRDRRADSRDRRADSRDQRADSGDRRADSSDGERIARMEADRWMESG
ncbi:hypothetical protein TNCV_4529751 [Trichonephila clavipes]|nr:hypothetical protein TNCV_4529751 [Trichonephila clavipes]